MAILYHSPQSRSSTILTLIDELDAKVDIINVTIPRMDGSGARDPRNPHAEGKVPYLIDGDHHIRERGAIMLYLTDSYPQAGLAPLHHAPGRGAYLSWLFYYHAVIEPVGILSFTNLTHPVIDASLRDLDTMLDTLENALQDHAFLLGDDYSAADILCSSPFMWMPDMAPGRPAITAWVDRCRNRPAAQRTLARDADYAARAKGSSG
jgi:glutathione S-transferase